MFRKLLSHLRRQSLGALALFITLGGSSYAVATGSIDGREIRNNAVGTRDLRNNDIRGKDVRTGTLGSTDVKNDALSGADIAESSLGLVPGASTAGHAGTAATAGRAGAADNSAALNGRGPDTYEESAISGFRDGPVFLAHNLRTIATLPLPAGKYAVSAKLYVRSTSEKHHEVLCELSIGSDKDESKTQVPASGTQEVDESATVALQLVRAATTNTNAVVRCLYGNPPADGAVNARFIKITAISLDSLKNVPLGG